MSISVPIPGAKTASPAMAAARALPLFGWIFRDTARDVNILFYYIVILLTALVLAVKAWGIVALAMAALALVPVMFVLILWITIP